MKLSTLLSCCLSQVRIWTFFQQCAHWVLIVRSRAKNLLSWNSWSAAPMPSYSLSLLVLGTHQPQVSILRQVTFSFPILMVLRSRSKYQHRFKTILRQHNKKGAYWVTFAKDTLPDGQWEPVLSNFFHSSLSGELEECGKGLTTPVSVKLYFGLSVFHISARCCWPGGKYTWAAEHSHTAFFHYL